MLPPYAVSTALKKKEKRKKNEKKNMPHQKSDSFFAMDTNIHRKNMKTYGTVIPTKFKTMKGGNMRERGEGARAGIYDLLHFFKCTYLKKISQ